MHIDLNTVAGKQEALIRWYDQFCTAEKKVPEVKQEESGLIKQHGVDLTDNRLLVRDGSNLGDTALLLGRSPKMVADRLDHWGFKYTPKAVIAIVDTAWANPGAMTMLAALSCWCYHDNLIVAGNDFVLDYDRTVKHFCRGAGTYPDEFLQSMWDAQKTQGGNLVDMLNAEVFQYMHGATNA